MKQGEETPSTWYVFASQCGGEELSYATSSVGDRGEWAQAVGTTIVAGNSRGGLHGAGVRMTICVRAGWARAVGAMMRVVAVAVADMIARHETGRAIHAVMSRKIGMTAGAVVHLDAAGGPLGHHAATGTTHAAAVAARLTVRVIAQVIARCVGDARRYAKTGTRPLAGVAALAILGPHAVRRRVADSGATKTAARVVVPAWVARRACATHAWRAAVGACRHRSQKKANSHSRRAWESSRACLCWALLWHSATLCSRGPTRN